MGLYLKQDQQQSQMHKNLVRDLDKRLQGKPSSPVASAHPVRQSLPTEMSISKTWGAVFIIGGLVGLLLAFIVRQDPNVMHEPGTKVLASAGVASILFGSFLLMIGRRHSRSAN
ncbi:MAG TPA: hypothetical protein VGS28_01475 [Candidatus Saccharimonadales bacterium]|nr:hypothetical protein [Candidatus Saccharimonadales bacterium]